MRTVSFALHLWAGLAFWEVSVGSTAPPGAGDGGRPSSRETQNLGKEEAKRKILGQYKGLEGLLHTPGNSEYDTWPGPTFTQRRPGRTLGLHLQWTFGLQTTEVKVKADFWVAGQVLKEWPAQSQSAKAGRVLSPSWFPAFK